MASVWTPFRWLDGSGWAINDGLAESAAVPLGTQISAANRLHQNEMPKPEKTLKPETANLLQGLRTLDLMVQYKLGPKEFRILLALHLSKCDARPRTIAKVLRQPIDSVRVMFQTLRSKGFLEIHEPDGTGGWPSYSITETGNEVISSLASGRS